MKLIIKLLPLFFCIIIISCKSLYNPYREFEQLAIRIIHQPNSLKNIEDYYPQYYNNDFLRDRMQDSNYLEMIINEMVQFNKNNNKLTFYLTDYSKIKSDSTKLFVFNKQIKGKITNISEILEFDLLNDNYVGFTFRFIHKNNNYFLNSISKSFFPQ